MSPFTTKNYPNQPHVPSASVAFVKMVHHQSWNFDAMHMATTNLGSSTSISTLIYLTCPTFYPYYLLIMGRTMFNILSYLRCYLILPLIFQYYLRPIWTRNENELLILSGVEVLFLLVDKIYNITVSILITC